MRAVAAPLCLCGICCNGSSVLYGDEYYDLTSPCVQAQVEAHGEY